MSSIERLHDLGQSIWYDNIERRLLNNGELSRMIKHGYIRGITSNPSIFNSAISNSSDYDPALIPLARNGKNREEIYEALAIADIQDACDLFMPLYTSSKRRDGYVSLEVSPYLANKTEETLAEAERLWILVGRQNLMIKIPATKEGLPAIKHAVQLGINVNVTLIFSIDRYRQVITAYLSGLENRLESGESIDYIASVASFFISRIDSFVDNLLWNLVDDGDIQPKQARNLEGKVAIANAKLAYDIHRRIFSSEQFLNLKQNCAQVQRPLWASTSTKNPNYPDTKYVDELIGPGTINTIPPVTLSAFSNHGVAAPTLATDIESSRNVLAELATTGISLSEVTKTLERQGVKSFADAFTSMLDTIEQRRLSSI